jgi:hypothetical protein
MVMNAEFKSHKQVWQLLKPRVDVRLEARDQIAWANPLSLAVVPESLAWSLALMDPAAVAHGVRELASPLSE